MLLLFIAYQTVTFLTLIVSMRKRRVNSVDVRTDYLYKTTRFLGTSHLVAHVVRLRRITLAISYHQSRTFIPFHDVTI